MQQNEGYMEVQPATATKDNSIQGHCGVSWREHLTVNGIYGDLAWLEKIIKISEKVDFEGFLLKGHDLVHAVSPKRNIQIKWNLGIVFIVF
jgi:hypothetical protein